MTAAAPNTNTDIKWALAGITVNANRAKRPRDYYEGRHPLAFATEKYREAFGVSLKEVTDNLMPVIVDTPADRLEVEGFTVSAGGEGATVAEKAAREIWRQNRMEVRAGEVHQDAFADGDVYVIVWPDPDNPKMPTLYPNRAGCCVVHYDDERPGYITRAAKAWIDEDDGHSRLTLYYRDRIERYRSRQKSQGGLEVTDAAQYVLVENEPVVRNPFDKVPVFHFANRASIGQMGRTELDEAMPLADVLNKTLCDRLVAQEFYAFNQRYAIGLSPEEMTGAKVRPGGIWTARSKDVKFGEFSASDIGQYVELAESDRKEIARVSRTPLHYFTLEGSFPSGEAQKTADGPLLSKVRKRQKAWGMVWADVMRFALRIGGHGEHDVQTVWANTEPRSEDEELDKAAKKAELGIDERTVLTELGYTPDEIERILRVRSEEGIIPRVAQ
jgi:hypothetical protein